MNPQLAPLVQLQSLDLRSVDIKEQRRKIPELLGAAERPLLEAKRSLQDVTTAADRIGKTRREREADLEGQEAHIQKMKSRVTEIKKNVEYQAHLFEIQVANKKKGEIEEQILLLMEEMEQNQKLLKEVGEKVAREEAEFAKKKAELESLDSGLAAELAELDQKQQEVAQAVDKALMARYVKLKSIRKDVALAAVRDGICSGCRLQLAPQLVAEVRRSIDLLTCSFCQRILYWEEETDSSGSAPAEAVGNAGEGLPQQVES